MRGRRTLVRSECVDAAGRNVSQRWLCHGGDVAVGRSRQVGQDGDQIVLRQRQKAAGNRLHDFAGKLARFDPVDDEIAGELGGGCGHCWFWEGDCIFCSEARSRTTSCSTCPSRPRAGTGTSFKVRVMPDAFPIVRKRNESFASMVWWSPRRSTSLITFCPSASGVTNDL